jgi:hypothetical protein
MDAVNLITDRDDFLETFDLHCKCLESEGIEEMFGRTAAGQLTVIIKASGPPAIIRQKPEIMMKVKIPRITQFFHLKLEGNREDLDR